MAMIDFAKAETLEAMYRSVERMNQAIVDNNQDVYQSEVALQINLRGNFKNLQKD